jgi:hypothetical protein
MPSRVCPFCVAYNPQQTEENKLSLGTKHGITHVEYGGIITSPFQQNQISKAARLRKQAKKFDSELAKQREEWVLIPPSNMTITLHEDAGAVPAGLALSMSHEVGRVVLHKRLGKILEHDVTVDAAIDGDIESAIEAMNLGPHFCS